MNNRARERWGKFRALGFFWYVFVLGVMAFGMTMAMTLMVIFDWIQLPVRPHLATFAAIVFAIAGFVFGLVNWTVHEHFYHRNTNRHGFEVLPHKE